MLTNIAIILLTTLAFQSQAQKLSCIDLVSPQSLNTKTEKYINDLAKRSDAELIEEGNERGDVYRLSSIHFGSVYLKDLNPQHDYTFFNGSFYYLNINGQLVSTNLPDKEEILSNPTMNRRDRGDIKIESNEVLGEPENGQKIKAFYVTEEGIWIYGESNGESGVSLVSHKTLTPIKEARLSLNSPNVNGLVMLRDNKTLLIASGPEGVVSFNTETMEVTNSTLLNLSIPGRVWGTNEHLLEVLKFASPYKNKVQVHFYIPSKRKLGAMWINIDDLKSGEALSVSLTREELNEALQTLNHSPTTGDEEFLGVRFFRVPSHQNELSVQDYRLLGANQFNNFVDGVSVGTMRIRGDLGYIYSHETNQRIAFDVPIMTYEARVRFDPVTGIFATDPVYSKNRGSEVFLGIIDPFSE